MKNRKILVSLVVLIGIGFFFYSSIFFFEQKEKEQYKEDTNEPCSLIRSPPSGSWHKKDFQIRVLDEDLESGIKEDSCQYKVLSYGPNNEEVSSGWKSRKCNSAQTISVGPEGDCCFEGKDSCYVYVRSQDNAGNRHSPSIERSSIRYYSINWTDLYVSKAVAQENYKAKGVKAHNAYTYVQIQLEIGEEATQITINTLPTINFRASYVTVIAVVPIANIIYQKHK